jgi:hypothetical protein
MVAGGAERAYGDEYYEGKILLFACGLMLLLTAGLLLLLTFSLLLLRMRIYFVSVSILTIIIIIIILPARPTSTLSPPL